MRWLRVLGGLAVLYVLALALGTLASLALATDSFVTSAQATPALATLGVVLVGVVVAVLAAGPADHWTSNPYW